jgi:cobalamin biosynthesis Mg chelatase CobN
MWPKMLFEVLPHIGRLVPMAEKFFATRGAREAEEQASLNTMAETLRSELGRVSAASAGVQQALAAQAEQTGATAVEVTRIRIGVETLEGRLGKLEGGFGAAVEAAERADRSATRTTRLFVLIVVLLVAVLAMMGYLMILVFRVQGH